MNENQGRSSIGRFRIPDQLASFVSQLAALYSPSSAIDPCCEDLALLRGCRFAQERRALFRNPTSLREANEHAENIVLELGDITRMPLNRLYELVVTNLPFGARDVVDGRPRRLDLAIAERCLEIVAPNGVCLMVVPLNFLTGQFNHEFRQRVQSHMALDAVIGFPSCTFDVNFPVAFALLVIRHGSSRSCGTFFGEYAAKNQGQLITAVKDGVGNFFVPSQSLGTRWDRRFHDPVANSFRSELENFETRTLGDFGEIRIGRYVKQTSLSGRGEYLVLTGRHLRQIPISISDGDRFINRTDAESPAQCLIKPGDVIFSLVAPAPYVYKTTDPPAVAGDKVAVLRTPDNEYVSTYLNTPDGRKLFERQVALVGSSLGDRRRVSIAQLREIRIPLLPLAELNAVSDVAIATAAPLELEDLRLELLRVKEKLKIAEADLERQRKSQPTEHDELLKTVRFIEIQNAKILEQQQATNAKLDQLVFALASMRDDIGGIKQSSREDEEKLTRICAKLDAFTEASVGGTRTIQEYVDVVQTWLDRWESLDALTQKFLPSAEQIYDLLEKQANADFSPFVIQYCRAFENEILKKLFCAYHAQATQSIPDRSLFLKDDLAKDEKGNWKLKSWKFAKNILSDKRDYCLGDMSFIMQLAKPGGETLAASPLLQDFRKFVVKYFDQRVAEKEFLERLERINKEFRIKSAHPYLVDKATADDCLTIVRLALSELLDSYRTGTPALH